MARLARVVVPGIPYHVTHRGNRRQDIFFSPADRQVYRAWLTEYGAEFGLEVWAYCLMSNHVHLLVVPRRGDSLARAIGQTHMRHARRINAAGGWSGHLWEHRFFSTALDDGHLWAAARYIERNPVRAGLVAQAEDYPWSSARGHVLGERDPLLSPCRPFPNEREVGDWAAWLAATPDERMEDVIRRNTRTGRPCGSESFVSGIGQLLGRVLTLQKRGRKPKEL